MRKLLLIIIVFFVFSCDSSSPTEVATEGLIDSVCRYDDFEYLAGYGYGCTGPSICYTGEDLASLYCELEGYSSYVQFDEINTSFSASGTIAWTGPPYDNIQEATCSDLNYFGNFSASEYCPVIYNLVCE